MMSGSMNLQQMYLQQLQTAVRRRFMILSVDDTGNLHYTPGRKFESEGTGLHSRIASIIDDEQISINLDLIEIEVFNSNSTIGGSFMGNTYDAQTGSVQARQIVDPVFMESFDATTGNYGAGAVHELTEAYEGGCMAIEQCISIPNSRIDEKSYKKAHSRATPIPHVEYYLFDKNGKKTEFEDYARRIEFYWNNNGYYKFIMQAAFQK